MKVKAKSAGCATKASVALTDILFSVDEMLTHAVDGNKTFPAFDQKKIAALKYKQCVF